MNALLMAVADATVKSYKTTEHHISEVHKNGDLAVAFRTKISENINTTASFNGKGGSFALEVRPAIAEEYSLNGQGFKPFTADVTPELVQLCLDTHKAVPALDFTLDGSFDGDAFDAIATLGAFEDVDLDESKAIYLCLNDIITLEGDDGAEFTHHLTFSEVDEIMKENFDNFLELNDAFGAFQPDDCGIELVGEKEVLKVLEGKQVDLLNAVKKTEVDLSHTKKSDRRTAPRLGM